MAERTCSIDGCQKGGKIARGWCAMHYKRWQKYGDPLAEPPPRKWATTPESFWAQTRAEGACLVWTGHLH